MQMIVKAMLAALWLVIVPGATGILCFKGNKQVTLGETLLAGYLFLFCAGELFLLPAIVIGISLHTATLIFGSIMLLAAGYGIWFLKDRFKYKRKSICKEIRTLSPWFWIACVMIAVQVFIVVRYAHMDADDAFYLGTATSAVETDTLFSIDPYTGFPYETLPKRYVLSPFPVLLAMLSKLCLGLHPAILAHVFYPLVFLPVMYLCLYYMGKKLFPNNRNSQGLFLVFAALLTWFSGFSVYTSGNFALVRIWQGKAVLAALLLPLTFYICWCIFWEKEKTYSYALLFMANVACCHVSSMGIMLSPVMIGLFTFIGAVKNRSLNMLFRGAICCIPSLILGCIYILL